MATDNAGKRTVIVSDGEALDGIQFSLSVDWCIVSWQSIGGNLSAHRRRLELARRCRQYQRRGRYEVSPYEIYARLYNSAHPARHISARRLNRVQIQRALHLFYNRKMPTDYRRQR